MSQYVTRIFSTNSRGKLETCVIEASQTQQIMLGNPH